MLPVPSVVRDWEAAAAAKRAALLQELAADQIDPATVPLAELNSPETEGPWLKWHRNLKADRAAGRQTTADAKEELLSRILRWRDDRATELGMAPAGVMTEAMAKRVAFARITDAQALTAAGVRIRGVEGLAALMRTSLQQLFPNTFSNSTSNGGGGGGDADLKIIFPPGVWHGATKWKHVKMPAKKPPACFDTLHKFQTLGQSIQEIALGRGILPATVLNHLLDALTHGCALDLGEIARQASDPGAGVSGLPPPPTRGQWTRLETAAFGIHLDPVETPGAVKMKDLLLHVPEVAGLVQEGVVLKPGSEGALQLRHWYGVIRWWQALKRCGFEPVFSGEGVGRGAGASGGGNNKRLRVV